MDRKSLVYRGSAPDSMICDQELRILPNGDWIVLYMTGGDTEPSPGNYISLCRSKDQGATWGRPVTVLRYCDRAATMSEVILHEGVLTVHVQLHDGIFGNWRNVTISSADNGLTWSAPVSFAPCPYRSFVRNLYIAKNGDWFQPVECFGDVTGPFDQTSIFHDGTFQNPFNAVLISRDCGKNWRWGGRVTPAKNWAENNLVELSDGRMVMLIRFGGSDYLYRSESADRGETWTPAIQTTIFNSDSKIRLFRLKDGRFALLHNTGTVRNPLSLSVSDDDMKSWGYTRVLTDFPGRHSYPGGVLDEESGMIHFAFDFNRHDLICWSAALPPANK